MKSFFRLILSVGILTTLVSSVAVPEAIAIPWAQANPQAYAAANAYADAYAEAVAIGHPDPESYALAASDDDCATIACHASCGLLIIAGTDCSLNSENTYAGPYNTSCLCSSGSSFLQYYAPCMDCGWTLWKYYGGYVSSALAACGTLATEPTGTSRCSTTLTDSYTIDTSMQGCSYLGNCPTTTSATVSTSSTAPSSSSTPASSTTSSSTSTATTSSTSQTLSSAVTTYTGTTYTVTTDLSFTYSYSPGGETTDCFTTSYNFPQATNNPIEIDFISWDDKHFNTNNYTTYFFFNFTSDQTDVTDIQLITGTSMKTAVLTPDSQIWVNLNQGLMGFVTSGQNNMAAYNLGILITYKDTHYLYAYSCLKDRLTLKYLEITADEYDSCYRMSYWGFWNDLGYCDHRNESFSTTVEFRPKQTELPASSSESSVISSSSAATSTSSAESSSSVSNPSSVVSSSETTSQASSTASSSDHPSSETTSQASSTASSSDVYSEHSGISSSESVSSEASSAASSPIPSESSPTISSTASSTSSSSPSSTLEPELSGELVNGEPHWSLSIPGDLGPWNSVSLVTTKNETGSFNFNNVQVLVNGEEVTDVTSSITADSIELEFTFSIGVDDELIIEFGGVIVGGSSFTTLASLTITTQDGRRVVKRAEQTWELSNTITADAASSSASAESSSAETSIASSSSIVSESSSVGYLNGTTSTAIVSEESTTLVTVTSCSEDKCTEVSSTAQVTVVTSTHEGVVTTFTTYCPLSTTTTTAQPETTVVTVTSCSEDKCSQVESTAQVTIVTSTENGVVTSFTTYCPLSSSVHQGPTNAGAQSEGDHKSINAGDSTTIITVTSCFNDVCSTVESTGKVSIATTTQNGVASTFTTYGPTDSTTYVTEVVTSTQAGEEITADSTASTIEGVSTFEGAANMIAGSFIGVLFPFLFI